MRIFNIRAAFMSVITLVVIGCDESNESPADKCSSNEFFCEYDERTFEIGFSTWPYASTEESVTDTYQFISDNSDIYSEHIDSQIPWDAWINGSPLPEAFTNDISARASRKISTAKLTVSVSLLNSSRDELASDYDGSIPSYTTLNDAQIENAYFNHLKFIVNQLSPDYLLIAIEVNELLKNVPDKWDAYKALMTNIRTRIKNEFPTLSISESITLHNFYEPDVASPTEFITEIANYANSMDFVAVSFYPFFKGLNTKAGFQEAFDFLHEKINRPIAISETGHLSEDLSVESIDLFIPGNRAEQNDYLESLFTNAQDQNYEYIIWWTHRDYDALWATFPDEAKELGKLWISTGLINEDGAEKESYTTWQLIFEK